MDITQRLKIGILFNYGKDWMGGVIYIINLVKSLDKLPDLEKPEIIIFYNDNSKPFVNEITYPYVTFIYRKTPNQYFNYLFSTVKRKNCFEGGIIDKYKLDGLFPLNDFPFNLGKNNFKAVAWYPDLQHKFYPQYFSRLKYFSREWRIKQIIKNASHIVLSSNDVYSHFQKFYNLNAHLNIHILRFTSIIDGFSFPSFEQLRIKYDIKGDYFIVSNQFYQHKNHITVFKALKLLKDENINCKVLFTGTMEDKKNPKFIEGLKRMLIDLDIQQYVRFVGLINRVEQLCLMKNSLAVIQPSLFEGWSTVIEDAKALKCPVIASNLEVHKEQLANCNNGFLFEAQNASNLSDLMKTFINNEVIFKPVYEDNNQLTIDFAKNFIKIFSHQVVND
jgi:glycosyltransferase involved in cell wall biosynthesis